VVTVLNGPTLTAVPNIAPLDLEGLACRCGVLQHEDGLLAGLESIHMFHSSQSLLSPHFLPHCSSYLLPTEPSSLRSRLVQENSSSTD
jgi:hypothetical protein